MQDSSQTTVPAVPDSATVQAVHDTFARPVKKPVRHSMVADTSFNRGSDQAGLNVAAVTKKSTVTHSAVVQKIKPDRFFGDHELKVVHQGPQSLNRVTPDWVFPLLLLIVFAFAWLRTYYQKYFTQIITAFFNNNLTNQIVRDENILVQRASVLLNVAFNLVAALFLYYVSVHLNWPMGGMGSGLNRYLFFALIVSAAYALKFLVLKICGYLFNLEREMAAYIFNIFLINSVLGILLIPMVAFLAFSIPVSTTWVLIGSVILVGAAFVYRIIRGVLVGIASPVARLYYLFLYLCTLEFAPLMVLVKILNKH